MEPCEVKKIRKSKVVESNSLAQTKLNDLTAQQNKIALLFISKIKYGDRPDQEYYSSISEICATLGLKDSGTYYTKIKADLLKMAQPSWFPTDGGKIETIAWFSKVNLEPKSGAVSVFFDTSLHEHLFELTKNFTQFMLKEVLPLKSRYSIRLYQVIRSKIMKTEQAQMDDLFPIEFIFDIDDLKQMMNAEEYKNFSDFKRFALDKAMTEINKYCEAFHIDGFTTEAEGKKVTKVTISVRNPKAKELISIHQETKKALPYRTGKYARNKKTEVKA